MPITNTGRRNNRNHFSVFRRAENIQIHQNLEIDFSPPPQKIFEKLRLKQKRYTYCDIGAVSITIEGLFVNILTATNTGNNRTAVSMRREKYRFIHILDI
jgi:hypothetical protein